MATGDSLGSPERTTEAAERAGARVEVLDGVGHWWMLQDPDQGAEMLARCLG